MKWLVDWFIARATRRDADFYIGGRENPYLKRWWVIPRNRWFNIYLHNMLRDDDDRALHDHPFANMSILLRGGYHEVTYQPGRESYYSPLEVHDVRTTGNVVFRRASAAHRLIRMENHGPTWSLFITGPRTREWGFHCPRGWVHWKDFVAADDVGTVGRGCGE